MASHHASPQKHQPPKGRKGYLRAAFAAAVGSVAVAAALFGGAGMTNGTSDQFSTPPTSEINSGIAAPDVVSAFGQSAVKADPSQDPAGKLWNAMRKHEKRDRKDAVKMAAFAEFMAQFDYLKGAPLDRQAAEVNRIINQEIVYYPDQSQYNKADYWADPFETIMSRKGDCEDYAILEKAVLRYLGVPESRMFVAAVNSQGHSLDGGDHVIFLLNTAPDGAPPVFSILSDMEPVLPADNAVIGNNWIMSGGPEGGSWRADFVLVGARNDDGYWKVPPEKMDFSAVQATFKILPKPGPAAG